MPPRKEPLCPPDTEDWRRGQHKALHQQRIKHDCDSYPAVRTGPPLYRDRLGLIYERRLGAG